MASTLTFRSFSIARSATGLRTVSAVRCFATDTTFTKKERAAETAYALEQEHLALEKYRMKLRFESSTLAKRIGEHRGEEENHIVHILHRHKISEDTVEELLKWKYLH